MRRDKPEAEVRRRPSGRIGEHPLRTGLLPWGAVALVFLLLLGGVALVAHFGLGLSSADSPVTAASPSQGGASTPRPAGPPADGSETASRPNDTSNADGSAPIRAVSTGQNGVRLLLETHPGKATTGMPTVGDPIAISLTLSVPEDHWRTLTADGNAATHDPFTAEALSTGQPWGDAEILDSGRTRRYSSEGRVRLSRELKVTAFRSGTVELPPLTLPFGSGQLLTPPASLQIQSVLANVEAGATEGEDGELEARPYRPPVPLPLGGAFWSTAALLALACLLLAGQLWRQGSLVVEMTAGESRAGGALEQLLTLLDELRQESSVEAFHVRLSFGLRRYLGRRLTFPATESTTSEVRDRLEAHRLRQHRPRLETSREVIDLLRLCDRVKFAGLEVDPTDLRRRLGETRRLAKTLESELRPPSPSPGSKMSPSQIEAGAKRRASGRQA